MVDDPDTDEVDLDELDCSVVAEVDVVVVAKLLVESVAELVLEVEGVDMDVEDGAAEPIEADCGNLELVLVLKLSELLEL